MTPLPDQPPTGETLEEIVHKIVKRYLDDYINDHQLEQEFLSALRNERERCAKVADDNGCGEAEENCCCSSEIARAIREGK